MDKLQARATRAVNDFLKEKKRRKDSKVIKDFQEMTRNSDNYNSFTDTTVYTCRYCPKAFSHPKYVVHHMLRRHSETLLKLHDDCIHCDKARPGHHEQQTVSKTTSNSLDDQVEELKQVLQILKSEVFQQLELSQRQRNAIPTSSCSVNNLEARLPQRQKKYESLDRSFTKELKQLKSSCKSSEETIYNLERRCSQIVETVNENMACQASITKNANDNQKLFKELKLLKTEITLLKDNLEHRMNNMKISLSNEFQKFQSKSNEKLQKMDEKHSSELKKLNIIIDSRLTELQQCQNGEIEKIFEQHLQNYLTQLSLQPTRTSSHKKPLPTVVYRNSSQKKNKSSPKPHSAIEKSTRKPHPAIEKSTHKSSSNPAIDSKKVESSKKIKTSVDSSHLDETYAKIMRKLNSKMKLLGIPSSQNKIPSSELKPKIKALKDENRQLQAKYFNFQNTRKNLEELAENRVHALMLKAVPKRKITFASPESTVHDPTFKKDILKKQKNYSHLKDSLTKPKVLGSSEFIISASESETSSEVVPKIWIAPSKEKAESSETNYDNEDVSSISHESHTTDSIVDAIVEGNFKKNVANDIDQIESVHPGPSRAVVENICTVNADVGRDQPPLFAGRSVEGTSQWFTFKTPVASLQKHNDEKSSLEELDSWDIDDDSSDVDKAKNAD